MNVERQLAMTWSRPESPAGQALFPLENLVHLVSGPVFCKRSVRTFGGSAMRTLVLREPHEGSGTRRSDSRGTERRTGQQFGAPLKQFRSATAKLGVVELFERGSETERARRERLNDAGQHFQRNQERRRRTKALQLSCGYRLRVEVRRQPTGGAGRRPRREALPVCVDWGVLHRRGKTPAAVRHARPDHGAVVAMRQAMTPGRFAPVFWARALLDGTPIAPGMRPAHASGVSR